MDVMTISSRCHVYYFAPNHIYIIYIYIYMLIKIHDMHII